MEAAEQTQDGQDSDGGGGTGEKVVGGSEESVRYVTLIYSV